MRERVFEDFTNRARRAVVQAQEEARSRHHDYIGTEHLLLGLIAQPDDPLMQMFRGLGLQATKIRDTIAQIRPPGPKSPCGSIPFTPPAKAALARAAIEAQLRGHKHIDAEHLLWALSRQPGATAAKALTRLGATPDRIRRQLQLGWGQSSQRTPPKTY